MSGTQLLTVAATAVGGIAVLLLIVAAALGRLAVPSLPTRRPPARRGEARQRRTRHRFSRRTRRILRLGIGGVSAVVVVLVALELVTLYVAVDKLNRGAKGLNDAAATLGTNPDAWTSERISAARVLSAEARVWITSGNDRLAHDPLLKISRHVPYLGNQVSAVVDLADTEVQGGAAFDDALLVASAVNNVRGSSDPPGTRLLRLISQAAGPWTDADQKLSPALSRLNQDLGRSLLPPIRSAATRAVSVLQPIASVAQVGGQAARYMPAALGEHTPQNYLVLLDNPSEIRPAGGFAGSIGYVTFSGGTPSTIEVKPQEAINPAIKQHNDIPYPLARYMKFFRNSLEIGDAGWDPDFPTTAKLSEQLYTQATGRPVDGTISVDPYAVAAFLQVTGPVDVPGYGSFNSDNFFAKLNFIVNVSSSPGSGKGALTPIGQTVLSKILKAPASEWPRLLLVAQQQAQGRHIQAYFHDQQLATAASRIHYDGGLLPVSSDYLMIVDGNVGATKGDFYAKKEASLKTVVSGKGVVRHQLDVTYEMPLPVDDTDRGLNPGDGSYRDYVRFFLPESATVASFKVTSDGKPSDGSLDVISYELGHQVIGAFFRVPRGHQTQIQFFYEVPVAADKTYELMVQKEAGVPSLPLSIQVSYPGGQLHDSSMLIQDAKFSVQW